MSAFNRTDDDGTCTPAHPLRCEKGDDSRKPGDDFTTFGINVKLEQLCKYDAGEHINMIAVYGSEQLRDRIVFLLNSHGMGEAP